MEKIVSYCGLICTDCPIHLATNETNKDKQEKMRVEIALKCNELYKTEWTAENITDCDGCKTEGGRLFSGCINCKVRPCAIKKGIPNCACCKDYECEILREFFIKDPEAKERLDSVRAKN